MKKDDSDISDDGYVYVIGKFVTSKLFEHSLAGKTHVTIDIWTKRSYFSRSEQFKVLSQILNFHWKSTSNIQFLQMFSVSCPGYLPVSIRNRYIHFTLAEQQERSSNQKQLKFSVKGKKGELEFGHLSQEGNTLLANLPFVKETWVEGKCTTSPKFSECGNAMPTP